LGIARALTKPVRQSQLYDAIASAMCGTALEPRPVPAPAPPPERTRGRVLVAEDNPVNQKVAAHLLEQLGYLADVVGNGEEAIDALELAPYTAVLMDCQMPEMDGYEATRRIRDREGDGPRTPIIAMTAAAMEGDREKCLAAGMDDYIAKPMRAEDLESAQEQWLTSEGDLTPAPVPQTSGGNGDSVLDADQIESLRQLSGGGENLLAVMADLFLRDTPTRLETMKAAAAVGDAETLARAAHNLIGSCGNVGALRMVTLCRTIDQRARAGDVAEAPALVERLAGEFALVETALREKVSADTP